jgi:hypothetical protein
MTIPDFVKDNPWVPELKQRGKEPPNTYQKSPEKPQKTSQKQAKPTQNHTTPPTPTKKDMYFGDLTSLNAITRLNKRLLKEVYTGTLDLDTAKAMAYIMQVQVRALAIAKSPMQITQQTVITQPLDLSQLNENDQLQLARVVKKLGW